MCVCVRSSARLLFFQTISHIFERLTSRMCKKVVGRLVEFPFQGGLYLVQFMHFSGEFFVFQTVRLSLALLRIDIAACVLIHLSKLCIHKCDLQHSKASETISIFFCPLEIMKNMPIPQLTV